MKIPGRPFLQTISLSTNNISPPTNFEFLKLSRACHYNTNLFKSIRCTMGFPDFVVSSRLQIEQFLKLKKMIANVK